MKRDPTVRLKVLVTPRYKDEVKAKAALAGMTVSDYIRIRLENYGPDENPRLQREARNLLVAQATAMIHVHVGTHMANEPRGSVSGNAELAALKSIEKLLQELIRKDDRVY